MKKVVLSAALIALMGGSAFAQCDVDQNAPTNNAFMAAFSQGDLAQSFQHQNSSNICGAGIFLQPGIGGSDNVTIELWTTLPDEGGQMLASASAQGTQGQWVDVFWSAVSINSNTTLYLHFTGNQTLGISGDVTNQYPFGQVYANSGFGSFPGFDYTFRTYSDSSGGGPALRVTGACPGEIALSWTNTTPDSDMGILFATTTGGFVIGSGPCAGTALGLGTGNLRLVRVINSGSNGSGQVTGQAGTPACGGYLQLVIADGSPCATSNVAQIP